MEAKTSTITLKVRHGLPGAGDEVDAYFNVAQYTVNGPWLIMTHTDGVVTMIRPDPAHMVVVTPDAD